MDDPLVLATLVISIGMAVVLLFLVLWFLLLFRPWLQALLSGTPVPLAHIIGMRLRRTPPGLIVDTFVALAKRGNPAELAAIETLYLAQGRRNLTAAELADLVERQQSSNPSAR